MRQDDPDADDDRRVRPGVTTPRLVRREQLDVDAQEVRTLLRLRQGAPRPARRHRPAVRPDLPSRAEDAALWHDDVAAYDVSLTDGDRHLGRIYLDLHPREGKYKHAAQFDLVRGRRRPPAPRGRARLQLPARPDGARRRRHDVPRVRPPDAPRARRPQRVGPLLRASRPSGTSSRRRRRCSRSGRGTPTCCARFAHERGRRGDPGRARRADARAPTSSARATDARSRCSTRRCRTGFHAGRARDDLTARSRELQSRYSLFPLRRGHALPRVVRPPRRLLARSTTRTCGRWSSPRTCSRAFDRDDLFDPEVAGRYRDRSSPRVGSSDAADLVEDFLGRPYTFDAYAAWLAE